MLISATPERATPFVERQGIDCHPHRRAAQIEAARLILRRPCSATALREACNTLLMLSSDPGDLLAARSLRRVEDGLGER